MTIMTAGRPRPGARASRARRTGIRRPGSGIGIDPAKLTWFRSYAGLSREELSGAVTRLWLDGHPDALPMAHRTAIISNRGGRYRVRYWDGEAGADRRREFSDIAAAREFKEEADALLPGHEITEVSGLDAFTCTLCGFPVAGGLTRDAIAKEEAGERQPKPRTVRALCAALSAALGEPVLPRDLMPGGRRRPLPQPERERQARLDRNRAMVDFADALGRPELYRNSKGRISYTAELNRLYDQHMADQAEAELAADEADSLAS